MSSIKPPSVLRSANEMILGGCVLDLWEFGARPEIAGPLGEVVLLRYHISHLTAYFTRSSKLTLNANHHRRTFCLLNGRNIPT